MRNIKLPLVIVAVAMLLAASCKKEEKTQTLHDKFVGHWRYKTIVTDMNGNGVQDGSDSTTDVTDFLAYVNLRADGSGELTSVILGTDPFNWSLSSDNNYLIMTTGGEVAGLYIVAQPGNSFIVKDTADNVVSWETFVKE